MTADVARIRRHGWARSDVERAVAALAASLGTSDARDDQAAVPSDDLDLARELVRCLDRVALVDVGELACNLTTYGRGLPPVGPRYEAAAEILGGPAGWRIARLRAEHDDPTDLLVGLVCELNPAERVIDDEPAIPAPHRAALEALGELGTPGAVRFLASLLGDRGWGDGFYRIALRGLMHQGAALLEPALALWPTAGASAREVFARSLGAAGAHDDRFLACLVEWLDGEGDYDEEDAVHALGDYGDPRGIPILRTRLDRAIARADRAIAGAVLDALAVLGAEPAPEQSAPARALLTPHA